MNLDGCQVYLLVKIAKVLLVRNCVETSQAEVLGSKIPWQGED